MSTGYWENILRIRLTQQPPVQQFEDLSDDGFTDWYMPAICELGRFIGLGDDAGCGNTNPNLYTTLFASH
ncbi:hypothetical protein SAMN02746073_1674 [Legionella jamestowniensis DSM 19215]|uniref:Uncharacterized protein n=1 Tax=Legionella jamestowniensis TaxID=455 RepID=A0A0W0UW94_9GAMM|nr:hypothetical protein Ljam_0358 [Legionella jamestowniensis]SFL75007.1 hypothetical protein SAMN02746073_1674 [Legionella jamestowniensis DSM 19215]